MWSTMEFSHKVEYIYTCTCTWTKWFVYPLLTIIHSLHRSVLHYPRWNFQPFTCQIDASQRFTAVISSPVVTENLRQLTNFHSNTCSVNSVVDQLTTILLSTAEKAGIRCTEFTGSRQRGNYTKHREGKARNCKYWYDR